VSYLRRHCKSSAVIMFQLELPTAVASRADWRVAKYCATRKGIWIICVTRTTKRQNKTKNENGNEYMIRLFKRPLSWSFVEIKASFQTFKPIRGMVPPIDCRYRIHTHLDLDTITSTKFTSMFPIKGNRC